MSHASEDPVSVIVAAAVPEDFREPGRLWRRPAANKSPPGVPFKKEGVCALALSYFVNVHRLHLCPTGLV